MPQAASVPVISSPLRSDVPARAAGTGESAGGFGELLEASAATTDGSADTSAQTNSKTAPVAQVPGEATAAPALPTPTLTVDLALLAPGLPVEAGVPAATTVKSGTEIPAGADDAPADPARPADDPATAAPDAKGTDAPAIALLAPVAPAPNAPAAVSSEPEAGPVAAANTSPVRANAKAATTEAPAWLPATAAEPPASAEIEAAPAQPAAPTSEPAAADKTAHTISAPDGSLPAEPTRAVTPKGADTKPAASAEDQTDDGKSDSNTAKVGRPGAAAAKAQASSPAAANVTHAHAPETPRPAGETDPAEAKPAAHQASEHASATARAAGTAAPGDLVGPTSIAQAVTAQGGIAPPAFGLHAVSPLASPLQALWQPATQRAEPADNAVPISGLAVEIVSRVQDGNRRFEIRLDPPELGRIDVRLDVDRGGNVTSRLTVERAETLDLLRRDAPQLERALQHAGLNTEGGLQFSLRDQSFANRDQASQNAATLIIPDDEPAAAEAARRGYGRLIGLGGGIDIRV